MLQMQGKERRTGGLLIQDVNGTILDLTLFKFDREHASIANGSFSESLGHINTVYFSVKDKLVDSFEPREKENVGSGC